MTNERNTDIAIIGMSGKFPGADNVDQFWLNIVNKINSIAHFSDEELIQAGISEQLVKNPNYIKAKGYLERADYFDAEFFKFSKHEAEILDPQYRLFFESTWEALENSACVPSSYNGKIGVFAGSSNIDTYFIHNLANIKSTLYSDNFVIALHNAKDFLSTLIAYKLNLKGPAITIQTACSTSLVAVCMACQNLLAYESDIAIAGGTCVTTPLRSGYLFQNGMMLSATGKCCSFDKNANGTVLGNGVGVVVLKRLEDAIRDRDNIHAVIKGYAVNNDGGHKIGFTAPGISGQHTVIQEALTRAKLPAEMISYVETHGTGTILGDLIEFEALSQIFNKDTISHPVSLGAVKPNIGHLDAASGIAGLIKTIEALKNKVLPPNINFTTPSSQIDLADTPFKINTEALPWPSEGLRYAGVSSFGMGGTNAHIILEEATQQKKSMSLNNESVYLIISARSIGALEEVRKKLTTFLKHNRNTNLSDVAYTLKIGREHFKYRKAYHVNTFEDAINRLENDIFFTPPNSSETHKIDEKISKWLRNDNVNWGEFLTETKCRKLPLPTYPFERKKYWVSHNELAPPAFKSVTNDKSDNIYDASHIEKTVTDIFENFLIKKNIDLNFSFHDLGGDSFVALLISHEINKVLHLKLPFSIFDNNLSIRELSKHIASHAENQ